MHLKLLLSLTATPLPLAAFYPYILSILKQQTKPHVFSWIIWGITTLIAFALQWTEGGGLGSWPTGFLGVLTLGIAWIAFIKRGEISITKWDWFFFLSGIAVLPFWYLTSSPLLSMILLTTVDSLGFFPTIRKSYYCPYDENITMYVVIFFQNLISIGALERITMTTILFPAVTSVMIAILVTLILSQRAHYLVRMK